MMKTFVSPKQAEQNSPVNEAWQVDTGWLVDTGRKIDGNTVGRDADGVEFVATFAGWEKLICGKQPARRPCATCSGGGVESIGYEGIGMLDNACTNCGGCGSVAVR